MKLLVRLVAITLALWLAVRIVPGLDFKGSPWALVVIALIIGLVNAVIRPILTFLSLPLILVTLGLFVLVVNALAFLLAVWISGPDVLDLGITSDGFWPAFWGALIVSVVSWLANRLADD